MVAENDVALGRLVEAISKSRYWKESAVFVLEDLEAGRCVGSSMILHKNGTPESPYFWLEVSQEERRSVELGKRFVHTRLRLRST